MQTSGFSKIAGVEWEIAQRIAGNDLMEERFFVFFLRPCDVRVIKANPVPAKECRGTSQSARRVPRGIGSAMRVGFMGKSSAKQPTCPEDEPSATKKGRVTGAFLARTGASGKAGESRERAFSRLGKLGDLGFGVASRRV